MKPASLIRRGSGRQFAAPRSQGTPLPLLLSPSPASRHMDDRLYFLLAKSVGRDAIVTTVSGARYKGILVLANPEEGRGMGVVLHSPELFEPAPGEGPAALLLPDTLVIQASEFLDVELLDVDTSEVPTDSSEPSAATTPTAQPPAIPVAAVSPVAATPTVTDAPSTFRTDSAISGRGAVRERELQKWADEAQPSTSSALEWGPSSGSAAWDQFAVNERKFGVELLFDEHLYTTRINKDSPEYKERLKRAEKLAREIEGSSHQGSAHLAEERGVVVDDSGMDEEDKYSGVDRRGDEVLAALRANAGPTPAPAATSSRYVPPAHRAADMHNDPAIVALLAKVALAVRSPQQKEALEHTRKNVQLEINSLKQFASLFKVPHKKPDDLPMTSKKKEEEKVPAASSEASAVSPEAPAASSEPSAVSSAVPPVSASPASASSSALPLKPKLRMNPQAPAFRLNPAAALFTPAAFLPPTPAYPPQPFRPPTHTPRPYKRYNTNAVLFFGRRLPVADHSKKKSILDDFNMFANLPPVFPPTFMTPPTWANTVDRPWTEVIPRPAMVPGGAMLPTFPPGGVPQGAGPPAGYGGPGIPMMPGMVPGVAPMGYDQFGGVPPGFVPNMGYPGSAPYMAPPSGFQNRPPLSQRGGRRGG